MNHPCLDGFCGCSVTSFSVASVAPQLLIVLDRSDSMNELVDGISKWDMARQAIGDLVQSYEVLVRFGLLLYPGSSLDCSVGSECDPGVLAVEPAEGNLAAIEEALSAAATCSLGTPTAEALAGVGASQLLGSEERASFVLLITDGLSTCEPPAPAAAALLASSPSVPSYVVGFGDAVDAIELRELAEAGGTAKSSPLPGYYQVRDASELAAALLKVAGASLPCWFDLASSPKPRDSDALLYFGTELVPVDETHTNGWDYDTNTNRVTVYGEACRRLASKQVSEASLVYTCSSTLW